LRLWTLLQAQVQTDRVTEYIPHVGWARWADFAAVDPAPSPGTNREGHRVHPPRWDEPGGPTLRLWTLLQAQVQTDRVGPGGPTLRLWTLLQAQVQTERVTEYIPHVGMGQVGRLCGCGPCFKPRYKQIGSQSTSPTLDGPGGPTLRLWILLQAQVQKGLQSTTPRWDGPGGPTLRLWTLLQTQVQTERVTEYIPHVGMDQVGQLCGCGTCSKPRYKQRGSQSTSPTLGWARWADFAAVQAQVQIWRGTEYIPPLVSNHVG
jgi:hypothetical protein